jgi:hypothetical protein
VFFSLGILERDGACIVVGGIVTVVALVIVALVLVLGVKMALFLITNMF